MSLWRFLLFASGPCLFVSTAPGPLANTPYGAVRGFILNGTKAWRGIPYAAPPMRDLRFRPPQPPAPWHTNLDTIDFKASCVQWGSFKQGPAWRSLNISNSSEDCLYVNVYAPASSVSPLPVIVYLHAGEFRFGSSNDWESDWPYFADGQIVLVTANVRLGFFGFAALDVLRSRDPSGSAGNYGMQDQRAVLRWVNRSISFFGGDSARVTIMGESSGGSSVGFHLVSKASRGLFSKVILESPGLTQSKSWNHSVQNTQYAVSALTGAGSVGCTWPKETQWIHYHSLSAKGHPIAIVNNSVALTECEKRPDCFMVYEASGQNVSALYGGGNLLFNVPLLFNVSMAVGASGNDVAIRLPNLETATACLVNANVTDMVALISFPPLGDTFATDASAPTVDGVELSAPLEDLSVNSELIPSDVPVLAGSNLDEGTEFMYLVPRIACNASEEEFAAWAVKMFGPELGPKVPALYRTVEQPAPSCRSNRGGPSVPTSVGWVAAMRSAGDKAITCRTRQLLQAAQRQGSRTWWYYFTHTPNRSVNEPEDAMAYMGAFHGAEVPFVFGDGFELSNDDERALSKAMGCYWINFAATGNPNDGPSGCAGRLSLPEWPAFGKGDALEFSAKAVRKRPDLKASQCGLFDGYEAIDSLSHAPQSRQEEPLAVFV